MISLFVDTSYDISIGLLDEKLGWIKLRRFAGQKVSHVIQKEIHLMLAELGLKLMDLKRIFTVSGPGFYTGLRLSEGFADVLSFSGTQHLSFYTFDIPRFLGHQTGIWVTKAYRGEYFFFHWSPGQELIKLISSNDLDSHLAEQSGGTYFIHSHAALDEKLIAALPNPTATMDFIEKHPQDIFSKVILGNTKKDSYYFRAPEDEFRVSL